MKTICFLAFIVLLAQFANYAQAGVFDSLTGGKKKSSTRKKTRDDKRAEFEEVAKEAMSDKTIKNTPDSYEEEEDYEYGTGKVPKNKKKNKKEEKGWLDSMIPESLYDPLPSDKLW